MVEAIVGVALRAVLASIVLGGLLGLGVFAATRLLALRASTRHALWTMALIATALMPLAGVGVSVVRGLAAAEPVPLAAAGVRSEPRSVTSPHLSHAATTRALTPAISAGPSQPAAATLPDRLAGARTVAAWQPRLSRAVALGVVAIWLGGACIGLIGLVASVVRVRGLKKRSSPLDGALADELPWLTDGPGREIYLRLSFEIETPVAIGFGRPVILIPTELANVDGLTGIETLVLHEHAHLRRYDDWTNLVQRIIERIFWFNPILWIVGRRIALEREIASDDEVVEKTGAAHEYATSLWRLAREMRMPEHAVVAPGALLTRKQISVRIEQLLDKNRARLRRSPAAALGVVLAGTLAVAFVATSAPAVELPAATIATGAAPHKAAITASHAAGTARATAGTTVADPLTDQKIAEVESRYDPAAAAAPHQRQHAHAGTAHSSAPMPPMPPMPSVPSMPPIPAVPHPHPASTAVIRVNVNGHDISSVVREALRSIPAVIAQESASSAPRYHRAPGAVITREILAACTACSLRGADLHGQDLHGLTLNGSDLSGADLHGANLAGAHLTGVSLRYANLTGADLRGAVLNGVELRGANLEGAQLEEIRLSGVSVRGVNLRGTTLRSLIASCSGCDFSHMDLHGQDLHGITLSGADFNGADLHDANLSSVNFTGVDLSHANLAGADLTGASLSGCDLRGTNRTGIRTAGLRLSGSDID
jgi:uncharacterized protein YjbI with pentapeptide repeats/beta-lactamase regulating signal transducer with metallopeptidase domain